MVIDSSALIAILLEEPEAVAIRHAMKKELGTLYISAATVVEAYTVIIAKRGKDGALKLESLIKLSGLAIEGFHQHLIASAVDAWSRYGKWSGHKARLNFGDCFSYALAKHRNDRLLFKGNDFIHTDVKPVIY